MKPNKKPEFPITVLFHEDGEKWVLENEDQIACNLEWFDSADPEENSTVKDNRGRLIRLVVKKLEIQICELQ